MWTWGFVEAVIGGGTALLSIAVAFAMPYEVDPISIIGLVTAGLVALAHGFVYIKTDNRIRKLEEYIHLLVTNPEVLEKAKKELLYPDDPVADEQDNQSSADEKLIAKLNALDPQSRRVVESVIEAESKRSAE